MQTRLSTLCDKLLEAGWLAALIVAPLFFNVYSSRVFEPDKISLVRSLALLMAGAWLVKQVEIGLPKTPLAETARNLLRNNPLALPTFAMVVVYILATLLSVAPSVSLWGSYQRLQGTFSTFSYIVIFLMAASTLRTRAQLDRAISTIILTSFPIALYGIIQHFQLDPLPWGGDTTERVASNMGNSIFVAAYLIMVVPLVIARLIETAAHITQEISVRPRTCIGVTALGLVILAVLAWLWEIDFALGTGFAIVLLLFACVVGAFRQALFRDALLAVTYIVVLAAQLIAILFTQSRGPWLGLGAGLFAFAILGALMLMHRLPRLWRTITLGGIIGLATVTMAFLILFNLPASPFEALKNVPYVGRLGQILDPASPTARVRELIWEGALKLFLPHKPLWSPTTGDDPFNAIRPLVGYGPDAMYVAFNPFYPPALGQLEARNASPDRAHNETFDSLVMTGLLGFGAYILLFISIFYFGLKWLGLIRTTLERNIFVALWLVTGSIFAVIFGAWRGWNWIGVALPAGMIVGFLIFLIFDALRRYRSAETVLDLRRALWISALIAALIAHFVEIHFGIAIVSTRTHFWFYAALLVVLGLNQITENAAPVTVPSPRNDPEESPRSTTQKRKQRRRVQESARATSRTKNGELSPASIVAWTGIAILVLFTLTFEFINNQIGTTSTIDAIKNSLFIKSDGTPSAVFVIFGLTWLIAGILGLAYRTTRATWRYDVLLFAILSFTGVLWFVMFQTRWLTTPGDLTDAFVNLLSFYYLALFIGIAILAIALWFDLSPRPALSFRTHASAIVAPIAFVIIVATIYVANYTIIRADILYKAGTNYDSAGTWDRSIDAYQRAFNLTPTQDFYALFLGRAYLEGGRAATDSQKQAQLLASSQKILLEAQWLNPLNADHSANLARLERIEATMTDNPAERADHFRKSSEYYLVTTRISPNTAYLRNEWSLTLSQSGDLEQAIVQLQKSLDLDPKFAQTYTYLGDVYNAQRNYTQAADNYSKALEIDPTALSNTDGSLLPGPSNLFAMPEFASRAIETFRAIAIKFPALIQPHYALADLYRQAGQTELARKELEQAVQIAPKDFMANLTLVNFLSESGQIDAAVTAMRKVMDLVSTNRPDYQRFKDFLTQLQSLQTAIQTAQKSPNDATLHRNLAALWKARGQPQFALPEYQTVARIVPNDYDAQKNLVLLNLQLNHPDDAQRALVTAVASAPDSDKPLWQNVQVALNSQKAGQFADALKAAQAALALAADVDKPALQAYVTLLQEKPVSQ